MRAGEHRAAGHMGCWSAALRAACREPCTSACPVACPTAFSLLMPACICRPGRGKLDRLRAAVEALEADAAAGALGSGGRK